MRDAKQRAKNVKSPESLPNSLNLPFVEQLYSDYRRDPASVTEDWRRYFAAMENGDAGAPVKLGPSFGARSLFHPKDGGPGLAGL